MLAHGLCDPHLQVHISIGCTFHFIAFGINQFFVMAMGGFTSPQHLALAVENVGLVWFHWVIATIVPFYGAVYGALLGPMMGRLGQTMIQLVFGPNRMPLRFGQEIQGFADV
jgi:hypothetical protein